MSEHAPSRDATEYGKPFHIFYFKYPDYMMNIMPECITIDDSNGANMKCNYKGRYGDYLLKISPIGSHLYWNFDTVVR